MPSSLIPKFRRISQEPSFYSQLHYYINSCVILDKSAHPQTTFLPDCLSFSQTSSHLLHLHHLQAPLPTSGEWDVFSELALWEDPPDYQSNRRKKAFRSDPKSRNEWPFLGSAPSPGPQNALIPGLEKGKPCLLLMEIIVHSHCRESLHSLHPRISHPSIHTTPVRSNPPFTGAH